MSREAAIRLFQQAVGAHNRGMSDDEYRMFLIKAFEGIWDDFRELQEHVRQLKAEGASEKTIIEAMAPVSDFNLTVEKFLSIDDGNEVIAMVKDMVRSEHSGNN